MMNTCNNKILTVTYIKINVVFVCVNNYQILHKITKFIFYKFRNKKEKFI